MRYPGQETSTPNSFAVHFTLFFEEHLPSIPFSYVKAIIEPPAPDFAAQRERVRVDWEADRGEELNQKFYDQLRTRYSVTVEPVEPGKSPESPDSTKANPQTATTGTEARPLASLVVTQ